MSASNDPAEAQGKRIMNPILLNQQQSDEVLRSVIGANGKEYNASKICSILVSHSGVNSKIIRDKFGAINIADIVNKSINPYIIHLGIFLASYKPLRRYNKTRKSQGPEYMWGFFPIDTREDWER